VAATDESLIDAWFLLATAAHQGRGRGASLAEVIGEGDYLNHAIFVPQEIEHAVHRLVAAGLLLVDEPNSFRVTSPGKALVHASTQGSPTPVVAIGRLADAIDAVPPGTEVDDWTLDLAAYHAAYDHYSVGIHDAIRRLDRLPRPLQTAVGGLLLVFVKTWERLHR
jgi:hypothetical protein